MGIDEVATAILSEPLLTKLGDYALRHLGLRSLAERRDELTRAMQAMAGDLHFGDTAECARWLLGAAPSRDRIENLARHLTNGESYFFREPGAFDALERHILPELADAQRAGGAIERRLRIWSAGCATGEEPYSIAMLIEMAVPDLDAWDIGVLGTDVNSRFLRIAERGVYRDWSFRNVPEAIKERFFRPCGGGSFELAPRLRQRVAFSLLNLAEEAFSPPASGAVDVILCRNVLMYFEPSRARQVIRRFAQILRDGGWLIVGAAECSQSMFEDFETVRFSDMAVYRKAGAHSRAAQTAKRRLAAVARQPQRTLPATPAPAARVTADRTTEPYKAVFDLFRSGRYPEAADAAISYLAQAPDDAKLLALLARIHANRGALDQALDWSRRAVAANKVDAAVHFVQANILIEIGRSADAVDALRRAIFLAPDFAMAHYMLGVLAHRDSKRGRARRHLENAISALAQCEPDETVPEADGLTAGRLMEIARALLELTEGKPRP